MTRLILSIFIFSFPLLGQAQLQCTIAEAIREKFEQMETSPTPCEDSYKAQVLNEFQGQFLQNCMPNFQKMVTVCSKSLPKLDTSKIKSGGNGMCSKIEAAGKGVMQGLKNFENVNRGCGSSITRVLDICVPPIDGFIAKLQACTREQVDQVRNQFKANNNTNQMRQQFCSSLKKHATSVKSEYDTYSDLGVVEKQFNRPECNKKSRSPSSNKNI